MSDINTLRKLGEADVTADNVEQMYGIDAVKFDEEEAKATAGIIADMTPFVGGAKAAYELPEDLDYAKELLEQGYGEADLVKMGLGGAFGALTFLGFIPGAKIGTDVVKAGIKSSVKDSVKPSVKDQMDNLITPKRAEQLEKAKSLPADERRQYLKDVNRPQRNVFHGARNIGEKSRVGEKIEASKEAFTKGLDYSKRHLDTVFVDFDKLEHPKKLKKPLDPLKQQAVRDKQRKLTDAAYAKAQRKDISVEDLQALSLNITYAKPVKYSDSVEHYMEDRALVFSKSPYEGKQTIEIRDTSRGDLLGELSIKEDKIFGGEKVSVEDIKSIISDYENELIQNTGIYQMEIPKYAVKGEQLEKEGFAPYTAEEAALSKRRGRFEGDESSFGSASGKHREMGSINALSTSYDPLVSTKSVFGNYDLSNVVTAKEPKDIYNLTPLEYQRLSRDLDDVETKELKNKIQGKSLRLPKSSHLENELAIQKPSQLQNVNRLSKESSDYSLSNLVHQTDGPSYFNNDLRKELTIPGSTKGTLNRKELDGVDEKTGYQTLLDFGEDKMGPGVLRKGTIKKTSLAERVTEGQKLVNRITSNVSSLRPVKVDNVEYSASYGNKYYSNFKSTINDLISLGKYTENTGARGTFDNVLKSNFTGKSTTASNVVEGMREAADVLPQGEKRNNLYMTSNILEAIGKASETPKRQTRRITKDMSDKDLLDGLKTLQIVKMETRDAAYDKLNYKAKEIYANFSNMLDTGDSTGLSYTDLKRMLFLMSDKLNRGGLMVRK